MADAAEVVRHALAHPGLTVMALVPNRAAPRRRWPGVHKLTIPVSASAAHSLANVRKTPRADGRRGAQHRRAAQRARAAGAHRGRHLHRLRLHAAGRGARGRRGAAGGRLVQAGADESACPTPPAWPTRRRCGACSSACAPIGERTGAAHLHNTRGLGLANCLAAYDVGVRTFDVAGGLGGCPYAPGASGNVVTEDLVFMFEAMGVRTGIDLTLIAARAPLQAGLPGEPLYGMTPEAGLPKGFGTQSTGGSHRAANAGPSDAQPPAAASASSSSPTW
jgi:hydroxymethylglutaryl-CoA lyase